MCVHWSSRTFRVKTSFKCRLISTLNRIVFFMETLDLQNFPSLHKIGRSSAPKTLSHFSSMLLLVPILRFRWFLIQGGQIRRIFAYWAIVYFERFIKNSRSSSKFWTTFFNGKNGLGYILGHFLTNSSGHPVLITELGPMLWSRFSAIFDNFRRKKWRFSQKPMLWS
jgi:hypothetical protein